MYRDQWTATLVVAELVKAFKAGEGQGIAVYSQNPGHFDPVGGPKVVAAGLVARTTECLDRRGDRPHVLILYAMAVAGRRFSRLCSAKGWNRRTKYYAVERSAAAVAACLNEDYRAGQGIEVPLTIAQSEAPITARIRGQSLANKREKDARSP